MEVIGHLKMQNGRHKAKGFAQRAPDYHSNGYMEGAGALWQVSWSCIYA